jgi:hypothetical protein
MMERNQNRHTSHSQSKHRYGTSSGMPSDLKPNSTSSALIQGVPAHEGASGPFSTYSNRSDASSAHRSNTGTLDRALPKIIVSGVTGAHVGGSGSAATVYDRMTSIHSDVGPSSIGFSLYRPGFSEVLLSAANILESRANSGLVNSTCSEGIGSSMSELSPSSCADGMPVLLSQTLAERSPLAGYGSPAKSEEPVLKPSSSMPCLTPENDSEPIDLPSFITRCKEEHIEPVKCRSVCNVKRDLCEIGDSSEAKEELDFTDWVAMVCMSLFQ